MKNRVLTTFALLVAAACVAGCGGASADLSPEVAAHLNAYEDLIAEFEPRFSAVRNDPPEFAKVADAYQRKAEAWLSELQSVAPDPTEKEGRAIQARVESLNKRAVRMMAG